MHVELYPHGGNYGFRWEDFYTKRGPRVWREMLVASPNLWQFACTWYNSGGQSPGKTLFCPLTKTSLSLPCRGGCGEMPPEPQILYVVECGVICRICRSHCAADSSVFIDPTHAWEVSSSYAFALRTGAPKVSCGIPHCTELRTYARLNMAKKNGSVGFPLWIGYIRSWFPYIFGWHVSPSDVQLWFGYFTWYHGLSLKTLNTRGHHQLAQTLGPSNIFPDVPDGHEGPNKVGCFG